ncbi:right-handed parallel beta-helix repeat-containing protein [Sedimentisphaera salicampi]|uniref:right-handed parallel beta-helix repeat-containing protein n=1 Tax=Sedimentisphaera salicampi TaxID=1941349 RepID=UPI000B9CE408|nr:right-handed parallel beta-helix repeat-containing protein [Sedimentisphaera salicampi]OXU16186.1 parallel beta-helix repeat-containing protein [Sedimentisphaera salicampi]
MNYLKLLLVIAVSVALVSPGLSVENNDPWEYTYTDNFETDKAVDDSYDHSVFWPEAAFPPAEPYLVYTSIYHTDSVNQRGVLFNDFKGKLAHLNYCFPLVSAQNADAVKGYIEFDLKMEDNNDDSQVSRRGYFCYSVSSDGHQWTKPAALKSGHQKLELYSDEGTCYISLRGRDAFIDNLSVALKVEHDEPDVINVPEDYPTIQQAVDAAQDGQTVQIAPGTYSGEGNVNIDLLGKAITVRGAKGPRATVIDCSVIMPAVEDPLQKIISRGFYVHQGERRDTVIRNLTIENGFVSGSEIPEDDMRWNLSPEHPIGAGIYCEFASPTIKNCIITDCRTEMGAGIGCVGAHPDISFSRVHDCNAGGFGPCESGGFGAGIGFIRHSSLNITNCRVVRNSAYYNSKGAGLYCRRSRAKIYGSTFSSNSADGNLLGGGVYCGTGSEMMLKNCVVSNNLANCGAGIFAHRRLASEVSALEAPVFPRTLVRVENCTVANNRLVNPMPIYPGAGIHSRAADIKVSSSIVWYNSPTQIVIYKSPHKFPVTYSNVQGGYPTSEAVLDNYGPDDGLEPLAGDTTDDYYQQLSLVECPGNIDKEPLFADPVLPIVDYHLKSKTGRYVPGRVVSASGNVSPGQWVKDDVHSPSIDSGNPFMPFKEEPMPNGFRLNMGAYGNTNQASKSMPWHILEKGGFGEDIRSPDINKDGIIDYEDIVKMAEQWLQGIKGYGIQTHPPQD